MTSPIKGVVKQRQDPLRERYRTAPNKARITDSAKTAMDKSEDPFHATVARGRGVGRIMAHRHPSRDRRLS